VSWDPHRDRGHYRDVMGFIGTGIAVSAAAGLFTAAWGAYKDAPYERFSHASFWRSLAFSIGIFATLCAMKPAHAHVGQLAIVQVFFLVMGIERLAIEIYKPCFRREDQSKYFIPQDFAFLGLHLVNVRWRRLFGAVLIAATLALLCAGTEIATYRAHLVVAVVVGLFICGGGAAKDAPYEGFQRRKFLRSALVLAAASPVFYVLGPTPLGLLVFMNGGLERLIVESYKTYFTTTPPGKFRRDARVIDPGFLRYRPLLRGIALVIVTAVVASYLYAVTR
jgi:hypothetical protein